MLCIDISTMLWYNFSKYTITLCEGDFRGTKENAGRSVEEVNRLLKQFEMMKDMMKKMSSGNFKMPF